MKKLLQNRFFRGTILANVFTQFGASIYNLVFVVYVAEVFASKWLISIANSVLMIPIFFQLWIAQRADATVHKARWLLLIGWLQALFFLLVAFLSQEASFLTFAVICLLNVVSDCLAYYSNDLYAPMYKLQIPEDNLVQAYSINSAIAYTCIIAGQFFGLWLLAIAPRQFHLVAFINAGAFALSALLLWRIRGELQHAPVEKGQTESFFHKAKTTYQTATRIFSENQDIPFVSLFSCIILLNVLSSAISPILTIYYLDHSFLGFSYAQTLLILQLTQLVFAILGNVTPQDYFKEKSFAFLIRLELCVNLLIGLICLTGLPVGLVFPLFGANAFLVGKFNPKINAFWTKHVPDQQLAQVQSLISMVVMASIPLGTALFSSLSALHFQASWGLFLLLNLLSFYALNRKHQKRS